MFSSILSLAVAFIAGGGLVFIYLHKQQAAAIATANQLAADVASAKAELVAAKALAAKAGV